MTKQRYDIANTAKPRRPANEHLALLSAQEVEQMAAIDGPARGSRYADQLHYVVPESLADLQGPAGGHVTLDRSLRLSEQGTDY